MSTRARLTFSFTVLFGIIVVCLAVGTYLLCRQDAYSKLDSGLRAAVDGAAMSTEHEMAEHRTKEHGEADLRDVLRDAREVALPGTQILVREGSREVAFRNVENSGFDLRAIPSSKLLSGRIVSNARVQARELEIPKFHTRYQIYSAKSIAGAEEQLSLVRAILFLLVSLGLVLASFAGYLLARKSLAPLAALARAIETITSSDLSARVPVPHASDDISRLAASFNSLLDRLQQAFNMQRRFMADASHELRTPLTVALAAVQVTQHDPARTPEDSNAALCVAEAQMLRLKKLVDNLLLLAQADNSGLASASAEIFFDDVISDAVSSARTLAKARRQILKIDPLPEARCRGDQELLKQCLLILLDNAVKFTPPEGLIRIGLYREGSYWKCQVADSGIGIPVAAQPHIFERFFRAENSHSAAPGAGLGLAIAKSIAESQGGTLSLVESKPGGTTFEISLPALDETHQPEPDHANSFAVKM